MEKQIKNAYMTVEASLVFPLIFGAILFTISLALYLYNGAVLKQVSSIVAMRGSRQSGTNKEIEQYLEKEANQLIKERLLFVTDVKKEIDVSESKVQIILKAKTNLPFLQFPFLDFKWQELEFQSQSKRIKPVKIIRDARRIYGSKISE